MEPKSKRKRGSVSEMEADIFEILFPNEIFYSIVGYLDKVDKLSFRVLNHDFNELLDSSFLKFEAHIHNEVSKEMLDKLPSRLHTLDVSRSNFSPSLFSSLARFSSLKEVNFTGVTNGTGEDLQQLLKNLPKGLQKLHLRECKMIKHDENLLSLPMELQMLDLCGTDISDEGLKNLPNGLKSLKLAVCKRVTDKALEHLPSSILHLNLAYCAVTGTSFPPKLAELILRGCQMSNSLKNLPSSLQYLDIAHNKSFTGCEFLPRGLQGLDMAKCTSITPEDLKNLPPNLQHLNLSETNVHGLLKDIPHSLRYLSIVDCGVANSDLEELPNLLHLSVGRNVDVTDEGISLVPKSCLLLDVERCPNITDNAVGLLPKSLQAFHVEGCTSLTDKALLQLPNQLKALDLSFSSITNDGMASLPPSLKRLRVSHTEITNNGVKKMPQGIVMLDLSFTEVTDEVRRFIPSSVEYLNLTGCKKVANLCAYCGNGTRKISSCFCKQCFL